MNAQSKCERTSKEKNVYAGVTKLKEEKKNGRSCLCYFVISLFRFCFFFFSVKHAARVNIDLPAALVKASSDANNTWILCNHFMWYGVYIAAVLDFHASSFPAIISHYTIRKITHRNGSILLRIDAYFPSFLYGMWACACVCQVYYTSNIQQYRTTRVSHFQVTTVYMTSVSHAQTCHPISI